MHHNDFVAGVRSGKIKVLVDNNKSGFLYQEKGVISEKWRKKQVNIRTKAFGSIIVGIALFFFAPWYLAVAPIVFGLFYMTRANSAAGEGVIATAIERPAFYARVMSDGIIQIKE